MELPYINGKVIETVLTIDADGSIDEVRITFKDGQTLVITGEYINLRLETAVARPQATAVITDTTIWPGE